MRRPVAFSDGRWHDGAVFDSVQFEMALEKADVSRKGLEGIYVAGPRAGKQSVIADVSAYVVDDLTFVNRGGEGAMLVMFVAAQPTTVISGTDNPPSAAQRALEDGQHSGLGNETKRRANQAAAYLREIHGQELGMKGRASQGRTISRDAVGER